MSDPIDMLEDMFQNGEEGKYFRGDTVMQRLADEYITFKAVSDSTTDDLSRIVSRADRPKWHTSDAVIADLFGEQYVWVRDTDDGKWLEPFNGHVFSSGDLDNVVPLMKAVVTDLMVAAALLSYEGRSDNPGDVSLADWAEEEVSDFRRALEAAIAHGV